MLRRVRDDQVEVAPIVEREASLLSFNHEMQREPSIRRTADDPPISPITPPPSSRNMATEWSRVATSASPVMISTGTFNALTSASHAIGSCSRPLARLVPVELVTGTRELGFAAGRVSVAADFDAPLPDAIVDTFDAPSA